MLEFIREKRTLIIIVIIVILLIGYFFYNSKDKDEEIIQNDEATLEEAKEDEEEIIVVHITGEVKKPGVVRIKEGSRVEDIIKEAGGLTEKADITNINLA